MPPNHAFNALAALTLPQSGPTASHAHALAPVSSYRKDPAWLDRAIDDLRMRGFEPFLLFETWEEPLFRQRFAAGSPVGRLDWPPSAEVASQVRIYRPDDREKYLRGVQPPTEYAR